MMDRLCLRLTSVGVIFILIIIGGCASTPPSRFYVLSPLQGDHRQAKADDTCAAISVGPVELPDYVDRSQIVTRISPNKLYLAEFDQWAEPLKESDMVSSGKPAVPYLLVTSLPRIVPTARWILRMGKVA